MDDTRARVNAICAADDERIRAVLARDGEALRRVLCDELVYTHSSGAQEDKATYIGRVLDGTYDYRAFRQVSREFRFAPPFAFMHGDNEVDIVRGGELHLLGGRYQMAWREEGGTWRLFSFCAAPRQR